MADLKGSKTEEHLKAAFASESQANRRYLYFAQKADIDGTSGDRGAVPLHRRRGDGSRVRALRVPRERR